MMAKYQEEEMEQTRPLKLKVPKLFDIPEKFKVPEHLKSDRIPNLPSDTALESNKARQDKEAINALKKFGAVVSPGATAGMATIEALKNRKKRTEDGGETTSDGMKKGGKVSSASKRADGCATKGKTKGRMM